MFSTSANKSISFIVIIIISITTIESCIQSYPDHIIGYIQNHITSDPSIHNLGTKTSFSECQHSCINFNYLCNTRTDVIYGNEDHNWVLNTATCALTVLQPYSPVSWTEPISHDFIGTQYIIEAQLTITDGTEAGILWKYNHANYPDTLDYYFGVDTNSHVPITGYDDPDYNVLSNKALEKLAISYDTRYNLSVHNDGVTFTTYVNGQQHHSNNVESRFVHDYIGLYSYGADAIFHSLHVQFPNNNDEMFCSAFIYHKYDGLCYGYYGDNYTLIETSLATQSTYDAGIRYDSIMCPHLSNISQPVSTTLAPEASISASNASQSATSELTTLSSITSITSESEAAVSTFTTIHEKEAEVEDETITTNESDGRDESAPDNTPRVSVVLIITVATSCVCVVLLCGLIGSKQKKRYDIDQTHAAEHVPEAKEKDIDDDGAQRNKLNEMMVTNAVATNEGWMHFKEEGVPQNTVQKDPSLNICTLGEKATQLGDDEFVILGDDEVEYAETNKTTEQ